MSTFRLEVVVPDRAFYSDEVQELVVKTPDGEIGILSGHIPMVVAVSAGPLKIKKEDRWLCAFVSEGFLEVRDGRTEILADSAEWPEEIDLERAKVAAERIRKLLGGKHGDKDDVNLQAALQRALWRQKLSKSE